MEYTIEYDEAAEDLEELDTRLNALYSTRAGDQPMDREFGIDTSEVIGMPPEAAKNTLAVEIVEKTNKYIPEVEGVGLFLSFECSYSVEHECVAHVGYGHLSFGYGQHFVSRFAHQQHVTAAIVAIVVQAAQEVHELGFGTYLPAENLQPCVPRV